MKNVFAAIAMLLVTLAGAHAEPHAHVATFDGGMPAITSPSGPGGFIALEVGCLEFWISAGATTINQPMTAVELVAADAKLTLTIAADRGHVTLSDGATNPNKVDIPLDLTAGQMVHLGFDIAPAGTTVFVDGVALPNVTGPFLNVSDIAEPVTLRLGGPGFKGRIGAARLWSGGMDDATMLTSRNDPDTLVPIGGLAAEDFVVGQVDGGQIARLAVPATGIWHVDGASTNVPILKTLKDIPDVNHGQFADDEVFLSIFRSDQPFADFGVTTSSSFTHSLYLAHTADYGVYDILDDTGHTQGQATFRPAGNVFLVDSIAANLPLAASLTYKTVEVPKDGEQTQEYGEAWQVNDKPKNFEHSVIACYDGVRMNLFDFQEHGCVRRFFREPPAFSHRFDTGRNNLTIPWGWKYTNFSETRSHGFSDLVTSSSEVGKSMTGGSGYNFSLTGVTYQNNKTTEDERQTMRDRQRMRAYHQYVARRHSVVVDAKRMMLDQCFLRDVARLTNGVTGTVPKMPAYFDPTDTDGGECDALLDNPITLQEFMARYSDLYAYAITYGARAIETRDMSASTIETWRKDGVNASQGFDYSVSGQIGIPGTGANANFKLGGGATSEKGSADWTKMSTGTQFEVTSDLCVGGTGCANGTVEVGDNPVPIYLDLRPISDLLGPPYFSDPGVTVAARRLVSDWLVKHTPPPTPDVPMLRMFDVTLSALSCKTNHLSGNSPYTTMQQAGVAVFAKGARFGNLVPPTPVPVMAERLTDLAQADAQLAAACALGLSDKLHLELAAEDGGGYMTAKPARVLGLIGSDTWPKLSDMVNAHQSIRVVADQFAAAMGGDWSAHPQIYPRLRIEGDPNAGQNECAAPCGVAFTAPTVQHVSTACTGAPCPPGDTGNDFILYPVFMDLDLTRLKSGGDTLDLSLGFGVSSLKNNPASGIYYYVIGTFKFTEVTDIDYGRDLGYFQ